MYNSCYWCLELDCWDVNIMNCPSSQFTWSPQVAWSNVSDIRNDTIHPAGNGKTT